MSGPGTVTVADKYNLTDAEAAWVEAQDGDVKAAVRRIRSERIGSAADPEYRPLSAKAAKELGLEADETEPVTSDDVVKELTAWAEAEVKAGRYVTVDDALVALLEFEEVS